MTKEEKAKFLDNLLLKFEGNKSFNHTQVHDRSFYESLDDDFFVVENHLNFLIGDGMIKVTPLSNMGNINYELCYYSLTEKGFAVMTDLENLGYASKQKEESERYALDVGTYKFAKWSVILTAIAILLSIVGLIKCHSN